jgi:multiple sugar transport system permease protein/raffinose/stachyose/melibiose transport system permease protein
MQRGLNRFAPYIFILPSLILFTVFILLPIVWVFWLSLTDYTMLKSPVWVGLDNYTRLLQDSIFHRAIRNTAFYWMGTVLPAMAVGLLLANLLSARLRFLAFWRTVLYVPGVISSIAVALTWQWMLDARFGPVNRLLEYLGGSGRNWLQSPVTSLPSVILVGAWTGIGFSMIVFLGGIQSIPESLYEAASLDGASAWGKFIHVTLPLLRPITLFLFITATIRSFQVFDLVFVLTGGGPANSSTTIVTQIVGAGFQEYKMGYAAAMAVVLLGATLAVTLVQYSLGSRRESIE